MTHRNAGEPTAHARRRCVLPSALFVLLAACGDPSGSTTSASAPVCGNGVSEAAEECDDGNANNADGCLTSCRRPVAWTTSDVHVHSTGCSQYTSPSELVALLRRQQIQVAAALVWGEGYANDSAFFTGRDHPVSTADFILHYDLEISRFVAAKGGHLMLLGLDSLAFSPDVFHAPQSGVPIVEWAHRQTRAIVGVAHGQFWPYDGSFPVPPGGCCTPFEVVVHAARGRLDFLSMEIPPTAGPGVFRLWKALQNAGLRVAIAGGSDFSCISQAFDAFTLRTDAIVDGPLTYESWLAAMKAGRTAAAMGVGNHLNLRVEGHRLGEEVPLAAAQDVTVSLESAGKAAEVEILVNGEVATRVAVAEGPQLTEVRLPIATSSWIAARSPYVLTSPVYVLVAGRPIRASADDICYLWRSVEHLEQLVMTGRLNLYGSKAEALSAYEDAVRELQRRYMESGGGGCR